LDERALIRSLAGFLLRMPDAEAGVSDAGGDRAAVPREMAEAYRKELQGLLEDLEAGIEQSDEGRCRRVSLRIAGSAPALGLETLGKLARTSVNRMSEKGLAAAEHDLVALKAACTRHLAA